MLLNPTQFFNKYQDIFVDNSTGKISEAALRQFVADIIDSFTFVNTDQDNTGDSAYEVWLQAGNQGTAADFLASLRGGNAYEAWLEAGYMGTLEQFLQTLVGASAFEIWIAQGNNGTAATFLEALKGAPGLTPQKGIDYFDGKTAYEVAQAEGYTGTPAEWLVSLKGIDGKNALFVTILAELAVLPQTGQSGYGYIVNNDLWIWLIGSATWYNAGPLAGIPGPIGPIGKSAYQVWLEIPGNEGKTITQYQTSIKGVDGKSAYQIWLDEPANAGKSSNDFLLSLIGTNGKSAYEIAQDNGYAGNVSQWLASLVGLPGKSAYEIAVINGFVGTEADWLASLTPEVTGAFLPLDNPAGNIVTFNDGTDYIDVGQNYFEIYKNVELTNVLNRRWSLFMGLYGNGIVRNHLEQTTDTGAGFAELAVSSRAENGTHQYNASVSAVATPTRALIQMKLLDTGTQGNGYKWGVWEFDQNGKIFFNGTEFGTNAAASTKTLETLADDGTNITLNTALSTEGKVSLTGNRSLIISGLPGQVKFGTLEIYQTSGGNNVTLPPGSKVINNGAGNLTLTAAAGALDLVSWRWNGSFLTFTPGLNYN